MYQREIFHEGLHRICTIRAKSVQALNLKEALQRAAWEEMWARKQERDKEDGRKKSARDKAALWSRRARSEIERLQNLLKEGLARPNPSKPKHRTRVPPFQEPQPEMPRLRPLLPLSAETGARPPRPANFMEKLLRIDPERESIQEVFSTRCQIEAKNDEIFKNNEALQATYYKRLQAWEARKDEFNKRRGRALAAIRRNRGKERHGKPETLVERCNLALAGSVYPSIFPKQFQLSYNPRTRVLIVDYQLPPPASIPNLKRVRFLPSENRLEEVFLSPAAFERLYASALYQVCLRTIHELYQAAGEKRLTSVVFNGRVKYSDRATGKPAEACVLSIRADSEKFLVIDLAGVDPKLCFEKLGGVCRLPLTSLVPVQPLLSVVRAEGRPSGRQSGSEARPTQRQSNSVDKLSGGRAIRLAKNARSGSVGRPVPHL